MRAIENLGVHVLRRPGRDVLRGRLAGQGAAVRRADAAFVFRGAGGGLAETA